MDTLSTWTFDKVEVEDNLPLKYNGHPITAEEVTNKLGGKNFTLQAGPNVLEFSDALGALQLTLNGTKSQTITGPVHLNLSPNAVCIGDKCVMWPPAPAPDTISFSGAQAATSGGWQLSEVEADGVTLRVDGKQITPQQLKAYAGKTFELEVGTNVVNFEDKGDGSVVLTLNRKNNFTISEPLHLNFSPMAVCIGDKCLMWPKLDQPLVPKTPAKSWSISDLEVDGLALKVNGKDVTPDEVKALAGGSSLTLHAGPNEIQFEETGDGGISIRLNGAAKPTIVHEPSLHLNISQMALCIGDKCLMWPPAPKRPEPIASTPAPETTLTDAALLASLKSKFSQKDYDRLVSLLRQSSDAHHAEDPHEQYRKQVKHLDTREDWEKAIAETGNKPVIIDCSAVWCKPCKRIAPEFAKMSKEFAKDAVFFGVDVQVNTFVKALFKIESLPAFLFIRNGKEVSRLVGDSVPDLRKGIVDFIGNTSGPVAPVQAKAVKRTEFDYIVIGGGSGGMASAKEAAKHGQHVALFDFVKPSYQKTTWGLGGTCVNVGCVPKKLMHYASIIGETIAEDAPAYGWNVPKKVTHDWQKLVETVQDHVKKLNFFYENGLAKVNVKDFRDTNRPPEIIGNGSVTYFNGLAKMTGPHTVAYSNPNTHESGEVTGKSILVSVGGRPFVPSNIPGAQELSITSDDLFSLQKSPGKTLCVGAGYIALECAGFLNGLGYDVSIAVRSIPLRTGGFDRQCVNKVVDLMQLMGTRFLTSTDIRELTKTASGRILVKFYDSSAKPGTTPKEWTEEFDTVLYATGRGADTGGLGLEQIGVKLTPKGTVITDDADRTSVSHVYAIGDVANGRPELTPVAIKAGERLARRLFGDSKELMDYKNVPTTVFTPFEYGIVGYSEEDAIQTFGKENIEVFLSEFSTLEIGAAHRQAHPPAGIAKPEEFPTNCLSKLVCLKTENNRVVGAHFVGPNAGEITQNLALAIKLKATKKDFDDIVGIHPTDVESFVTLTVAKSSGEQWESAGGCGGGKCG